MICWRTCSIAVALIAASAAALARADTIQLKLGPVPNVQVTGIRGDTLTYNDRKGDPKSRPVGDVQKLTIDGQPAFNAAEDAYLSRNFPAARDNYQAALAAATAPAWLRVRSAQRLATVARAVHRYDSQVVAYVAALDLDPAAAAGIRPGPPQANDPSLDAAADLVARAITASGSSARRSSLLGVQLDIAKARGDDAAVTKTLQQLVAGGAATPAQQAMLKLATADVALNARQYAQAESTIRQSRALFTDPDQQVEALWVLAQARDGQTDSSTAGPDALRDVALAYMRVVAFGTGLPDRPHVPDALLRAAQIEEKLGDAAAAQTLYHQLADDRTFAGTSAATDARSALDRSKK